MTPEAKRTMKVKRFKKQSELRRKLEEMEKSGVVDGCARVKSRTAEEEEEEEGEEEADEEKVREYWFAMIEKAVLDSIEMIEGKKTDKQKLHLLQQFGSTFSLIQQCILQNYQNQSEQ